MFIKKHQQVGFFGQFLVVSSLCFAILGVIALPLDCQASEISQVVPPEEWTGRPEWSPDGRFVAVNWPAPPYIGADGKLHRVIGERAEGEKESRMFIPVMSWKESLAPAAGAGLGARERTIILEADTYKRLPVELPKLDKICWSPNGKMLAGMEIGAAGRILRFPSGRVIRSFDSAGRFAWSPDSKLLANAHRTGIDVWNTTKTRKVFSFPNLRAGERSSLAWSADGSKVAASVARSNFTGQKTLLRICSSSGKEMLSLYDKVGINSIGWSKDQNLFAYSDNALHILDGTTLKEIKMLAPQGANSVGFAWSPQGRLLAYKGNGEDTLLHVWDTNKMQEVCAIPAEKAGLYDFQWSPDGTFFVIRSYGQLALCRACDGKYLGGKEFYEGSGWVHVAWTPGSKALALSRMSDSVVLEPVKSDSSTGAFEKGSVGNPWQKQKVLRNLDDCFEELKRIKSADFIKAYKNAQGDELWDYQGEMEWGIPIRNRWALREKNPLTAYFGKMGITDGRDMSDIIIRAFWHYLNGKPYNLEEAAAGRREAAAGREYIIAENRPLSEALLKTELPLKNGKVISINKLPAPVKVVSFIQGNDYYALHQLKALDFVRHKYSDKQVSILVVKFGPNSILESANMLQGGTEFPREIKRLEEKNKSAMYFCNGTREVFNSLNEFIGGKLGRDNGLSAQTLILSDKNLVTTRINGPVMEEDTFPIEDAIDELLQSGGK